MKKTLALALAVIFVLAFATPVFAGIDHNATYKLDGTISLTKQVGHLCNTGAQQNQRIAGEGQLEKVMNTSQVQYVLTVDDSNDFTTAPDAVNNLTVSSKVYLCAPGKTAASTVERTYMDEFHQDHVGAEAWQTTNTDTVIADPMTGYVNDWENVTLRSILMDAARERNDLNALASIAAMTDTQLENYAAVHTDILQYTTVTFRELTDQIWAAQVSANPGESGTLTQDFSAAYGPWNEDESLPATFPGAANQWGFIAGPAGWDYTWASGANYVGNYFNMDQLAQVTGGTTQRYISISSPFSHAYLTENMTVTGAAEVQDTFRMMNISEGSEAERDWWELF